MDYYVYILLCDDQSLYTGITTDVKRRFQEHRNQTASRYTRSRGAKKILYTEQHPTRSAASKREAEIKRWRRPQKIALINSA